MTWKIWLVLISIVIYSIYLLLFNYTVIRKGYHSEYKRLEVDRGFIIICLCTLILPIFNILSSILFPLFYLFMIKGDEYDDFEVRLRDDTFSKIVRGIGKWLGTPIMGILAMCIIASCSMCPQPVNSDIGDLSKKIKVEWHHTENCKGHWFVLEKINFQIDDHDMWLLKEDNGGKLSIIHSPECSKCNPKETSISDWSW